MAHGDSQFERLGLCVAHICNKKAGSRQLPASCLSERECDSQTFVPHSSQNFAPGFRSCWQFAHLPPTCDVPHSLQNFAPACNDAPHLMHFCVEVASVDGVGVAPRWRIASVMAFAIAPPTANPAPSPAPKPAPPPGFCAASRIACAAWN